MASRSSSPALSDCSYSSSGSNIRQIIPDDFINAQLLTIRLDRLLGAERYKYHWQMNEYIIDAERGLDQVRIKDRLHSTLHCLPLSALLTSVSSPK
jgi:hypothetical protein